MLQQTQVATVVPYFERFLREFPTVQSLAAADERDVLRLWEGLGYYRRARQMHLAARVLVAEHDASFPRELEAVRALPGIGRYTAGAITSIAFDDRAPILEANTVRLLSRLVAFDGDPASTAGQHTLWQLAEALLPPRGCGEFNQALMELGSQVCTPARPACDRCPVQQSCAAFLADRQHEIPQPRKPPRFEDVREAAVVVRRANKVLLRQCQAQERWAGLWDFLRFPVNGGKQSPHDIAAAVEQQWDLRTAPPSKIATLKHGVTRFRITLDCYTTTLVGRAPRLPSEDWQWVQPERLGDYPLSTTGRKLARLIAAEPLAAR